MVPDYQSDLLLFVKNENQQLSRVSDVSNNIMLTSEVNYAVFHKFITNIPPADCMSPIITLAQIRSCQIPTVKITCKGLAVTCNLFC